MCVHTSDEEGMEAFVPISVRGSKSSFRFGFSKVGLRERDTRYTQLLRGLAPFVYVTLLQPPHFIFSNPFLVFLPLHLLPST